jgi:ArsR family transcriptional regulator
MHHEDTDAHDEEQAIDALELAHSPHESDEAHVPIAPENEAERAALEQVAVIFRAAGDLARLRLLRHLMSQERCVSELVAATGEQMSTVSQRLKQLREAGLVRRRRDGKHIYYRVTDELIGTLIERALAHTLAR